MMPAAADVVIVERRELVTVLVHGTAAGVVAGLVLGVTTVVGTLLAGGSIADPFRFATALVVGVEALSSDFPLGAALLLGIAIHLTVSAALGVAFVGLLALAYQLSARPWLLIAYGSAFAFVAWEVSFLAAVPMAFPFVSGRLDLATQLWNLVAYVGLHGPTLGIYVALVRPGVVGDWRAVGAPVTFPPSTTRPGND